jgi:hypothetical protein
MPLFIPHEHLVFNFGGRLEKGEGKLWDRSEKNLESDLRRVITDCLPGLEGIRSAADFVNQWNFEPELTNPNNREAVAYCAAKAGRIEIAHNHLEKLQLLSGSDYEWERRIADRAKRIFNETLISSDNAFSTFDEWEESTRRALSLCTRGVGGSDT